MKSNHAEATLALPAPGLMQQPAILLVVTGTLIGLNFPLGKIAGEAGISPVVWALMISMGAAMIMLPVLLLRRALVIPGMRLARYAATSALVSFVAPNLLLFSVIPHAGAGYTGLMFALSPVFTLAIATLFRLKTPGRLGLAGIAVGLIGAALVSVTRGSMPNAPDLVWLVLAVLIPVALAVGNVYRTVAWPADATPDVLAFWSHLIAGGIFVVILLLAAGEISPAELAAAPLAVMAQLAVSGLTFPVFYRLQQRGGPVLLSQIGYVASAVGLVCATVFLGERYSPLTWAGAGVIALGIGITLYAQRNERKQSA